MDENCKFTCFDKQIYQTELNQMHPWPLFHSVSVFCDTGNGNVLDKDIWSFSVIFSYFQLFSVIVSHSQLSINRLPTHFRSFNVISIRIGEFQSTRRQERERTRSPATAGFNLHFKLFYQVNICGMFSFDGLTFIGEYNLLQS